MAGGQYQPPRVHLVKSYGLTLCLKADPAAVEEYRAYHRRVWPEVLAGLREVGISTMRIYLLGRRLFMYVETDDSFDPSRDFARASAGTRAREWDRLMRSLQERALESQPEDWWAPMEEVFDLGWPQHLPAP